MCLYKLEKKVNKVQQNIGVVIGYKLYKKSSNPHSDDLFTPFRADVHQLGQFTSAPEGIIRGYGTQYPAGFHVYRDKRTAQRIAKRKGYACVKVIGELIATGVDKTLTATPVAAYVLKNIALVEEV